jgi:hypothetical protein
MTRAPKRQTNFARTWASALRLKPALPPTASGCTALNAEVGFKGCF